MRGRGEVTRAVVRFNNSPLSAAFKWGSSLERLPGAPCVSLIYKHIMEAERGEKTRSKICTLVRPWVSPALMYKATTKAPVDVCVCKTWEAIFFSFLRSFQLRSMTLIYTSHQREETLVLKYMVPLCAQRGSREPLQDSLMMKDNMSGCKCSLSDRRGKTGKSQNYFGSLIFF